MKICPPVTLKEAPDNVFCVCIKMPRTLDAPKQDLLVDAERILVEEWGIAYGGTIAAMITLGQLVLFLVEEWGFILKEKSQ